MINMINGKTLSQLQAEYGAKEGLEVFQTRCTGKTLGSSLMLIGVAMADETGRMELGGLRGNLGSAEIKNMKREINTRLDQMGLVGFHWEGDDLVYYPFKEHVDVQEVIQEVKVQVSPYDGEVVSPRSYRVVEYPTGAEALQYSVEQGDKSLRQALNES